jgi:hypothetical protein
MTFVADFLQPLAASERPDASEADARKARALISSPRNRVTAATIAQSFEQQRVRRSTPAG